VSRPRVAANLATRAHPGLSERSATAQSCCGRLTSPSSSALNAIHLATPGTARRFRPVKRRSTHGSSVRLIVALAIATCLAGAGPARAQSVRTPSVTSIQSAADSAAVLSMVVDHLLQEDSASDPIKPGEWRDPERSIGGHPRVFVRLGRMPFGAWAKPSIARMHAWRWRYRGWAIDSLQSKRELIGIPGRSYPVVLRLGMYLQGDTARVQASWDHFTCELPGGGTRPIYSEEFELVRAPSGWRHSLLSVSAVNASCLSRSGPAGIHRPIQ
jgi:hypothetical protein